MKKKIVIISNYYPPEIGAAANRIKNLAEGLSSYNNDVNVICPLPNYPKGEVFKEYKRKFSVKETINNVDVNRYWIYPSISKKPLLRFFSMISFSLTLWFSFFKLFKKKPDLFIIQSPPLFIALSGLILSKVLKVNNVLNVSDIWPLSALELGVIKKGRFYSLLERIEKYNYFLADKIIGQSDEIIEHINLKINKGTEVYRNAPVYKKYTSKEKSEQLKIVYAGLLGYAQGIFNLCKHIDFKELGVELHIYGAGMEEEKIINFINTQDNNIFFHGSVSALEIKKRIREHDIALVPLLTTIKGAVPSKIFELMQLGIPILYVGGGEGEEIIKNKNLGFSSTPGNIDDLIENILLFKSLSKEHYSKLSNNCIYHHKEEFNFENQLNKIRKFIL